VTTKVRELCWRYASAGRAFATACAGIHSTNARPRRRGLDGRAGMPYIPKAEAAYIEQNPQTCRRESDPYAFRSLVNENTYRPQFLDPAYPVRSRLFEAAAYA
jgi:hypothetical protein